MFDYLIKKMKKKFLQSEVLQLVFVPMVGMFLVVCLILFVTNDNMSSKTEKQNFQPKGGVEDAFVKFDYDNMCGGEPRCQKCKDNLRCLDCMHSCYNKFSEYGDVNNPYQKFAANCVNNCWLERESKPEVNPTFEIK